MIDKADWEPLVADILQSNVRGDLLYLSKLASCATAVALRRILMAAVHEVCFTCRFYPPDLVFDLAIDRVAD